jgi:hypothetical protein
MTPLFGKTVIHVLWYNSAPEYSISIKHIHTLGKQTWEHRLSRARPVREIEACPEGMDPEIWAAWCCLGETLRAQEREWHEHPDARRR